MKKLLFLTLSITVVACSGDDAPAVYPQPVTVPASIEFVTGAGSDTFTFDYDSQRRISKLSRSGDNNPYTMEMSYDASNRISHIDFTGSSSADIDYVYNADRISGIKLNGSLVPISYNPTTQVYSMGSVQWTMTSTSEFDNFSGGQIAYDPGQKGAFYNVAPSYHLLTLLEDVRLLYIMPKHVILHYNVTAFTHTYRDDGLIEQTTSEGALINYQYKQIL